MSTSVSIHHVWSFGMRSTGTQAHTFCTRTGHPLASTPGTVRSSRINAQVDINSTHGLSEVTIGGDTSRHYIPTASEFNHSLFDSFIVDDTGKTASIPPPTRGGLAEGYSATWKIMAHARNPLGEKNSERVKTNAPACPQGESKHTWKMPDGWDKNTFSNDHCGEGSVRASLVCRVIHFLSFDSAESDWMQSLAIRFPASSYSSSQCPDFPILNILNTLLETTSRLPAQLHNFDARGFQITLPSSFNISIPSYLRPSSANT